MGSRDRGYNLRLLGPLSIGAQVVCSTNEQKIKVTNTEIRNRYWAVMPNVKWTWLNLKIVSLYSRAAVGAVFSEAESGGESESMRPASPIRCRPWASLSAGASRPMPKRASVPRVRSSSVCVTVSDDGRGRGYRRTDSAYGEDGRIVPEHAGGFFPGSASGGRCAELSPRRMPGDSGEPPEIRSPLSELVPAGVKS